MTSEDRTDRLPASLRRSARARAGVALARLPTARLLTADGHDRDERHATWLELFFDLVFVAAIAQLAARLGWQPSAASLVRFAGLFVVIWWVWVVFSTYFDRFGTEDPFNRVAALVAMLLAVGLAASVPDAFADRTAPFAIAYALLKGEQLLLFERARRHVPAIRPLYGRLVRVGLFSVGCWLASLALVGSSRYVLWAAAILAELATPWLSIGAARPAPLNVSHLPERFGTFVLIVLGESVARLVTAAAQRPWTIPLCVVLAAAFTTIAAMWWISFNAIDHAAVGRGRLATLGYIYTQLPMVGGILPPAPASIAQSLRPRAPARSRRRRAPRSTAASRSISSPPAPHRPRPPVDAHGGSDWQPRSPPSPSSSWAQSRTHVSSPRAHADPRRRDRARHTPPQNRQEPCRARRPQPRRQRSSPHLKRCRRRGRARVRRWFEIRHETVGST